MAQEAARVMQQQPEQGPRARLLAEERDRRDPERRGLFWSPAEWKQHFLACIDEERRRDAALQQQMAALPMDDARQRALAQMLHGALEDDVIWYRSLLDALRDLLKRWTGDDTAPAKCLQELATHAVWVESRLHDRRVRLQQAALEYLERRRCTEGRLEHGLWAKHWQYLKQAWKAQTEFCQQAYRSTAPDTLTADRLRWCKQMRLLQQSILQACRGNQGFDRQGLAAAALLDAEIGELNPPLLRALRGGKKLLTAAIVAAISAVLTAGIVAVSIPRARDPVTQMPTPTAGGLSGAFKRQSEMMTAPTATAQRAQSEQLNKRGLSLMTSGDCQQAVPLFEAASQADASFYQPPDNLAFCLFEQGDVSGAIEQWQRAIALNPNSPDAHAGLGMALYVSGDQDTGRASYRKALEINPKYGDETWMRKTAEWSQRAIEASRPLRAELRR